MLTVITNQSINNNKNKYYLLAYITGLRYKSNKYIRHNTIYNNYVHKRYNTTISTSQSPTENLFDTYDPIVIKSYTGQQPSDSNKLYYPFHKLSEPLYTVIGIETTCDDTCVSVIRSDRVILSHVKCSQTQLLNKYGGVYPIEASKEHIRNLPLLFDTALKQANITDINKQIKCIGVAIGPGLSVCLKAGLDYVKQISQQYNIPYIGVNHIEAHSIVSSLINNSILRQTSLVLLITGGNTQLWYQKGLGQYNILGNKVDDSIGDCIDKSIRILLLHSSDQIINKIKHLSSHGAMCEKLATYNRTSINILQEKYRLTIPLLGFRTINFSFSGLKAQFNRTVMSLTHECGDDVNNLPDHTVYELCYILQYTILQQILDRINNAVTYIQSTKQIMPKHLIICGGVSSNQYFKDEINKLYSNKDIQHNQTNNMNVITVPLEWSTDNAIMIGWLTAIKYALGQYDTQELIYEPDYPVGYTVDQKHIFNILQVAHTKQKQSAKKQKRNAKKQKPSKNGSQSLKQAFKDLKLEKKQEYKRFTKQDKTKQSAKP